MLIMPYLTIKHETWLPSRSFRGKRNPVSAFQGISCRVSTKINQNVWASLGLPLQMSSPQLGSFPLPRRAPTCKQARTPINVTLAHPGTRDTKNQLRQESGTKQNQQERSNCQELSATVRNRKELSLMVWNHKDLSATVWNRKYLSATVWNCKELSGIVSNRHQLSGTVTNCQEL